MVFDVKIKYFGLLTEKTGKSEELILVDSAKTLFDVKSDLMLRYPELQKTVFRLAYNHKITTNNFPVETGCEIALMPPFSGG